MKSTQRHALVAALLTGLICNCSSSAEDVLAPELAAGSPASDAPNSNLAPPPLPPPELQMPSGQVVLGPATNLPIQLKGLESARLRVVPLRLSEYELASKYVGFHDLDTDPIAAVGHGFSARVVTRVVAAGDPRQTTRVDLDPFIGVAGPEHGPAQMLFAVLDAPGTFPRAAVIQRGGLASVLKIGGGSGLCWVTRTLDGEPEAQAKITLTQGASLRFTGYSDSSGLVSLPARGRLYLPAGSKGSEEPLILRAQSPHGVVVQSESWAEGVETWNFNLPRSYWERADGLRGLVTAERGIFRPGETVNLLGMLRKRTASGGLEVPRGAFKLRVNDPDGAVLLEQRVTPTRFGTLRGELVLAPTARLGRYQISLASGAGDLTSSFEVGKYRASRFEVKIGDKLVEGEGGQFVVPLSASYLWGAAVRGGKVQYRVSSRPRRHVGSRNFEFGNASTEFEDAELGSGELVLDEQGNGKIAISAESLHTDTANQSIDVIVEADVTDEGGDAISARSAVPYAPQRVLVGVLSESWVVDPTRGWDVQIIAEDAAGKAAAGQAIQLELSRRYWKSYTEETDFGPRYSGGYEVEVVANKTLTSSDAPQRVHFALPAGGSYTLSARVADATATVEESVWAYGGGAYGAIDNNPRLELRADRDSYNPGDTAKLFVGSPYAKSTALVSVEREGIISASVTKLTGAEQPVSIKLSDAHLPNVFVSVVTVPHGLDRGGPSSGIPLRLGYTLLNVSPEQRRLSVAVAPAQAEYRPGEAAEVLVQVKDSQGKPISAEVTLWAADEGVLMLTGYETPDPFSPLYAVHAIDVNTSTSLARFVSPDPLNWDHTGGDSEAAPESAFRSRFLGTAFFSKQGVVTNAQGEAKVKLKLPDNLTRWRVMAAAADTGQRFGRGEGSFTTKKPVQVVPALPRFLTAGDSADLNFIVHEQTGKGRRAKLKLSLESRSESGARAETGLTTASVEGEVERELDLAPNSQQPVRFRVKALKPGQVVVRASLSAGGEQDAVELTLPVNSHLPFTRSLIGDGQVAGTKELAVKLPASAQPGVGSVELDISSSVLASLGGGIDSLMEYPHGCVEQTTSRLIPLVMLEDLMSRSGDSRLSGAAHRSRMDAAVAHVLEHQNADGGFGLWPSSDSEGFLTAYALWGLTTAKRAGYSLPKTAIERGFSYLTQHIKDGDDMHGQFSSLETKPFAAFVLADSKRADGGLGTTLAGAKGLSRFASGLLGAALSAPAVEGAKTHAAAQLIATLEQARTPFARGGSIVPETSEVDSFSYGKDLRSTAIVVRALISAGKSSEAEPLVAGILAQRAPDGSWGTTYNNLWALYALAAYVETQAGTPSNRVSVYLGDKLIKSVTLDKTRPLFRVKIGSGDLPKPGSALQLKLVTQHGKARYNAVLRYVDTDTGKHAQEHGLSVSRKLLDATTLSEVTEVKRGQLLKVRLSISSPTRRAQVALIDHLPAGFEAIDTRLQTATSDPTSDSTDALWVWRELHDERVTFFADWLPAGTFEAEFMVRATRSGSFERPPASAEAMYDPNVWAFSTSERRVIR